VPNDRVILMAAYENLPGFVGQIFELSIYLEKTPKSVVQKIITKVSSVPKAVSVDEV
jgi:hypothetical protein